MGGDERPAALDRLDAFVGVWTISAEFPNQPPMELEREPTVTFEWTLDRQFLFQRSDAPDPIPNSLSVIAVATDGASYVQHYFDSRGVVRIYEMSFDGHEWTLSREKPDFTPLEFSQRFTATFEADNAAIRGRWEICHDGTTWEHDFNLTYTKV